jgi:uncharacterized protein (DUF433 family)
MPVFACYLGDCDNLALQSEGCSVFVARDALGREWKCVETVEAGLGDSFITPDVWDMRQAQEAAHLQGASSQGTRMLRIDCRDEADLRRKLVLETYPPAEESSARLAAAGWRMSEETFLGQPRSLTVTNDQENRTVQGANQGEVWYRAASAVLGPRAEEDRAVKLNLQPVRVPLREHAPGAYRVGNSRVSLDVVIGEYKNGADPESIVHAYDTLALADVYAVIAYYLANRDEVEAYLEASEAQAEELRREIEAKQPGRELRAKLLARQEQRHASAGQ